MTDLVEIRRFHPFRSYPSPLIISDSSDDDDEAFETLPVIINRPRHEVFVKPYEYIPSTALKPSFVYQRVHTPGLTDAYYRSYETPSLTQRFVRTDSSNERNIHLPKHAKKVVNRFLNNLEQAHENNHDENDDDCHVCRRLQSAMDNRQRQSISDTNRIVVETQRCGHSHDCRACRLLDHSDLNISNTKKQGKHFHVIETLPSNNPTITQVNPSNLVPLYPMGYPTYVDPNTGLTYTYDPNWQYNPNPIYMPNNPSYTIYNTTEPSTMDKATYTRMTSDDKTMIVHTSRNPTPRTPKVIIEQPHHHHRRHKKHRSTTVIKGRKPRTKTKTYI